MCVTNYERENQERGKYEIQEIVEIQHRREINRIPTRRTTSKNPRTAEHSGTPHVDIKHARMEQ